MAEEIVNSKFREQIYETAISRFCNDNKEIRADWVLSYVDVLLENKDEAKALASFS